MDLWSRIKEYNRTLLEMHIGSVFFGLVCQIVGAFFVEDQGMYARSLWFGILFATISTIHLYRSLDRALDYEDRAAGMMTRSYFVRYAMVIVILLLVSITGIMNPLVVFLGYMSMKVSALIQPVTHRLCNKLFHENE